MAEKELFKAWINPLQFIELEGPPGLDMSTPSEAAVLTFACTPGINTDVPSLIRRYREVDATGTRLFAAPAEDRILDKLVWPLRHAKACYMFGNYLGTISLSGMVAEMVAVLFFEISEFKIRGNPMDKTEQAAIFGSAFEKLSQDRRIKVLHAYRIIDDETNSWFDTIRQKRRVYLHIWSQDHERLPTDAREVYQAAISLVVKVIGQEIRDGAISLNGALVKYLGQSGVFAPEQEEV